MSNFTQGDDRRYRAASSAGQRDGKTFSVVDHHERRNVSWHRTWKEAQADAKRRNRAWRNQQYEAPAPEAGRMSTSDGLGR